MQPLVSVIVPVYKVEFYLSECIESILKQTYQNLEIILVDDGSPDDCGSICDKYAQQDKRIKVFHKNNEGLSEARNYGIERATGDYLSFVDSDDWIEPDMFETLVSVVVVNDSDIVCCGYYREYNGYKETILKIDKIIGNIVDLQKMLIIENSNNIVWNKLFRKSCFSNVSFPYGHVHEDTWIMHTIFSKVETVVFISKVLYHHRQNRDDSIGHTHSMDNLIDYWRAHKLRYDYFLNDNRFNTDEEITAKLEYNCAIAISRTLRWSYANSAQERKKYASFFEEMQKFTVSHFPCFERQTWPLFLRFSIFLARFNNTFVIVLLYYLNQGYRRVKGNFRLHVQQPD